MSDFVWNPWHGCRKYSEGCEHCYVYRRDGAVGRNASEITKNKSFDFPIKKNKNGDYKIPDGSTVFTCMTSDFFLKEADDWRKNAWNIIRERQNISFIIITKRILRLKECLPPDWGSGWPNVTICCTMENQEQCDVRFPVFNQIPIANKMVICEPLLSRINMRPYLTRSISCLIAGGESGNNARLCKFEWITDLRQQCIEKGVDFKFKQTGARFEKDGKVYRILRKDQHSQARKANIDIFKA